MESFHALIAGGRLSAREFRLEFNRVIETISAELQRDPVSRHLGDPWLWPELTEIYRHLTDLLERRRAVPKCFRTEVYTEKTLYSKDKLLFGQIDAFFINPEGIELVDYKSGSMMDGDLPKEDYANQLYFYAYLIYENYGIYPRSLTLIGKNSDSLCLDGSMERSKEIANDMRMVLSKYNDQINSALPIEHFSSPSSNNCIFCDAKPVCSAFWGALSEIELPSWSHAVIGVQAIPMIRSRLGGVTVELEVEESSLRTSRVRITRVFEGRYPDLQDRVGQRLLLTNIRQVLPSNPSLAEVTERSLILTMESGF